MKQQSITTSRIISHDHESRILKGNPLKDPYKRKLFIYLPPGYNPAKKYPALLAVVGFTGTGAMLLNTDPLAENLKDKMDRLISTRKCKPCMVVFPDCFNKLGGSQYINSSAIGNYEDYLMKEIIPFVEKNYPVKGWALFGKSSGGYGSMVLGMRHPDVFSALADHSGDADFELCYLPDFPETLDRFKEAGGPKKWLAKMWSDENHKRKKYMKALNIIAMAAHYSPNPRSPHLGIDFPFDLDTGEFKPEVWARWKRWDPVQMIPRYKKNLKKLKLIYIDCGSKDEFALHWGSRAKVRALKKIGIRPFYEEFDDGHMSIAYRYDVSIPKLVRAISNDK